MKILKTLAGLVAAAALLPAQQYTISTVAGIGGNQADYGDGTAATQSGVYQPTRVAVDSSGNLYIVQLLAQTIREVTQSTGVISTIIGTGVYGFSGDNSLAIDAEISDVHGIAVDSSGNIYLADTGNERIREIYASNGNINTIAGNGTFGYSGDGGASINAELGRPGALAIDSSGNIYVPDYAFSVVRKIDSKGNISTIAGTGTFGNSGDGGPANKATLSSPVSVAVDSKGNIYIGDSYTQSIREITTDGNIHTFATGMDAESLIVDASGNLYYPNALTNTVNKVLPSGAQIAIAGNGLQGFAGDGGIALNAELNFPYGLAIDKNSNIYVADSNNQVVRELTPVVSPLAVANAASNLDGSYSPGEIVVIYGSGIGPSIAVVSEPAGGVYPTQSAGTSVTFNGNPAPILYTSANQVTAVIPYAQAAGVTSTVAVTYQGNTQTSTNNPTAGAAPGIFTVNGTGSGQAAAINAADGSLNGPAHPARVGDYVSLYLTGEGYTNPGGNDGTITSPSTLPIPILPTYVTINGIKALVTYSGETPDSVNGLLQVNIQIPQLPPAQLLNSPVNLPVFVSIGGFPAQTGVTISVSN